MPYHYYYYYYFRVLLVGYLLNRKYHRSHKKKNPHDLSYLYLYPSSYSVPYHPDDSHSMHCQSRCSSSSSSFFHGTRQNKNFRISISIRIAWSLFSSSTAIFAQSSECDPPLPPPPQYLLFFLVVLLFLIVCILVLIIIVFLSIINTTTFIFIVIGVITIITLCGVGITSGSLYLL